MSKLPAALVSVVAVCLLLCIGAGMANAATYRFKPVSQSERLVTFRVDRVKASDVRGARITDGRRNSRVSVRRLRRAIRAGARVTLRRVGGGQKATATPGRRRKELLVVVTAPETAPAGTSGAASAETAPTPSSGAASAATAPTPTSGAASAPTAPTPIATPTASQPTAAAAPEPAAAAGGALFSDSFTSPNGSNGLISNEYAFWNPDPLAVRSSKWEVTSGSLFSTNGAGWSGRPDSIAPIGSSLSSTGSSVFRMRTKGTYSGSARQEVTARINDFGPGTVDRPATDWDGVVLWPRYLTETHLYFAYILRRDGRVAITKKCDGRVAGGDYYNGGSYFDLTQERYFAPTVKGTWYKLATEAVDNPDGSVTVRLFRDGRLAAEATDTGLGCAPIRGAARLGVRGDNADFNIDDYSSNAVG